VTVSATLGGVFLKGVAASRPAANAVAGGTVYSATDTGVISQSDGSSWSTWATIASGLADPMTTRGDMMIRNASNVTARVPIGSAGKVWRSDGTDPSWQTPAAPTFHGVFAYETGGAQSIPNSTDTKITFTSEYFDTDAFHDNGSNTSRITIPSGLGGYYLIGAHVQFATNASGTRALRLMKNGATINGTGGSLPAGAAALGLETNTIVSLVATDYIEADLYQTSGGSLNAGGTSGFDSNGIWAYLIGV
jgi:hypothetical protein